MATLFYALVEVERLGLIPFLAMYVCLLLSIHTETICTVTVSYATCVVESLRMLGLTIDKWIPL